ncbi:MAG: SMP-30/gluconolactonase/LRE family protein [Bacteroidota bacterium]
MKGFLFVLFLSLVIVSEAQKSKIIAYGATIERVATGFAFTEGPAVDPAGNVFFTDQPNDRIHVWKPARGVLLFLEGTGRSNGLYFDNKGNLLACADLNNELWEFDPQGGHRVILSGYEGLKFNGPNDLWVDAKGGIYFTDPFYKRKYWDHEAKEIEEERVYYLSPNYAKVTVAADGFVRPNGIVGTPDGKRLYVADIGDKKTYIFKINEDGTLTDRQLFVEMGSDGMTLDNKGNLYITGKGVTVLNKKGKQIEHIDVDENWTANVCFGGPDQSVLFITASKSVFTLNMKVKGVR